jgi:hypothetical protein
MPATESYGARDESLATRVDGSPAIILIGITP